MTSIPFFYHVLLVYLFSLYFRFFAFFPLAFHFLTYPLTLILCYQFQCSPGVIARLQQKILELEKMCKVCYLNMYRAINPGKCIVVIACDEKRKGSERVKTSVAGAGLAMSMRDASKCFGSRREITVNARGAGN